MLAPHFFKVTSSRTLPIVGGEYVEGLNNAMTWTPTIGGSGGYHFYTLEHLDRQLGGATLIWDVNIPADECSIVMGETQCKAATLIMRNPRPLAEILRPYTPQQQLAMWRAYPALMQRLGAQVTPEMYEAAAPQLEQTRGSTKVYNNGLHVTPDGEMWRCTFTRDAIYVDITVSAGTSSWCREFRAGHAYGPGEAWSAEGKHSAGTFTHGWFHGRGTRDGKPGSYVWGVFTEAPETAQVITELPQEVTLPPKFNPVITEPQQVVTRTSISSTGLCFDGNSVKVGEKFILDGQSGKWIAITRG